MTAETLTPTLTPSRITVRPLGSALGAEVRGVDMRKPMDAQTQEEVLAAWMEHLVLVFPEGRKGTEKLYKDRYRKENGRWRIEYGEYERIYELTEILERVPHFTAHWLGQHGRQLPPAARYDATTGRYV